MASAPTWGWDDIQGIITLAGFLGMATLGGIGYGALQQKTAQAGSDAAEARKTADHTAQALSDFKADAERRFVTDETLNRVEERIVAAIDRLGDRLDRVIDRKPQ